MYYKAIEKMPKKPNGDDLVNEDIKFPEVLLIDDDGNRLGIKKRLEALNIARSKDLDLLCVAPAAKPPVCKILNYGKYRFEQQKKAKEMKKNQKVIDIKEIQLSVKIGEHDFNTKLKAAKKFLESGDKVKVSIRFRGREMAFTDQGKEVIDRFIDLCSELSSIEKEPILDGRTMMGIMSSKNSK